MSKVNEVFSALVTPDNTQSLISPELDLVLGFIAYFMDLRITSSSSKVAKQATYKLTELSRDHGLVGEILDI
eukprot:12922221-Prorocentrum_lima.AAC.1